MSFIHLKTQTEFSITQGLNKIEDMVAKAASDNMGALAITDLNGMFASINFYRECRKKGIKPIIGCDVTVEHDEDNFYQLTVLAKNQNGYKSILALNSRAYTDNRKTDFAAIKEEWLGELQDVIILSGAKQGLIGKNILAKNYDAALEVASQMKEFFGNDFYIELQRDGSPQEEAYMDGAIDICMKLGIAPVATHPSLFLESEDYFVHETRYCIGNKKEVFSLDRPRPFNKEMYFKTTEEMENLFADLPQALSNTVAIAKKCNIELVLDKPQLPNFPTPNGENPDDYFAELSRKGLHERLSEDFPDAVEREKVRPQYEERLEFEIATIQKMKFPGYFLIVADFITWAKDHDIPVGPGRGSGAGSLVAYSMKITDLDPLPYNLLFERFLNPERVSMPDFDIDFCQDRREEVINYVRSKYGEDAVCQIGTFGTMAPKAVVRDVGRAFGHGYDFMDTLAKMVRIQPNKPMTLNEFIFGKTDKEGEFIIEPNEKLLARYQNEPDVRKLIDVCLKLEGLTKQVGTHAAGVVIAPTKLTDFAPLYTIDADSAVVSQFEKNNVETAGLVKFDFLGLRNLTIIKDTVDLINARMEKEGQPLLNLKKVDLNDQNVYKHIFCQGNTTGIFQFESTGMRDILRKAKPEQLGDIIAIVSLYRPGPMEIIPEWLESKALPEEKRPYPHPSLREMLKETYGYMVYQEQVMQCAQIIANYSLGEADMLRRAMGKKKPEEMEMQREKFIKGAAENKVNVTLAHEIFDLMEKFAGYGFNKSHAAAYSYLSYHTAYLKTYYPEEFLSANMNSQLSPLEAEKIAPIADDAKNNGIKLLPPNINKSNYRFEVEGQGEIRYGLGAIKGVGEKAANSIARDREENGPYSDFYNFLERVGKKNVNKKVMEALIKAGAFDEINPNRAQLFDGIEKGLDYVANFRKKEMQDTSVLGDALFDGEPAPKKKRAKKEIIVVKPELNSIEPWDELTSINNEKSVLGYFYSAHPYNTYYTVKLDGFDVATKLELIEEKFEDGEKDLYIGGLIQEIKWWASKKGAFVTITDDTSSQTVSMFSDFLTENKGWLKEDAFVSLKVKLQADQKDGSLRITANQGFNFEQTKKLLINKVFVGSENDPEKVRKFTEICEPYIVKEEESDIIAILCVDGDPGRRNQKVQSYSIKYEPGLVDNLTKEFGTDWVKEILKKDIDNVVFPELPYRNNGGKKSNYNNKSKPAKRSSFST
jgi:DNA polymerase III subunit alpha